MLVNIWATVTHFGDFYFSGCKESNGLDLNLLISEKLQGRVGGKQTWMVNSVYRCPGDTRTLLRDSYKVIRDAQESYLVLFTPGFADVLSEVPMKFVERYTRQIYKQSKVFNKKIIALLVGVPSGCDSDITKRINDLNEIVRKLLKEYEGEAVDLRNIFYKSWTNQGSRPNDLDEVADKISEAIINLHPSMDKWKEIHS